jgi:hypothetical protein
VSPRGEAAAIEDAEPVLRAARWVRTVIPAALFFLATALLAPPAAAQPGPAGDVLGLVRTESGRPVERADIRFSGDLPVAGHEPALGPLAAEATSGRGGRFRFGAPVRSGSLWVVTRDGLGAVIPTVQVGVPIVVTLRPLGSLQLEDDSNFRCVVQVLRPGAPPSPFQILPTSPGAVLRLPAGTFLLLVQAKGSWVERSVEVQPGAQVTIPAVVPEGQPIPGPPGSWQLDRWPLVPLPFDDDSPVLLAGPTSAVQRVRIDDSITVFRKSWFDTVRTPATGPPAGRVIEVVARSADGSALEGVRSTTWAASPGGLVQIAEARSPSAGHPTPCWLPAAPGPTRIVLRAPGHRPASFPVDAIPDQVQLTPSEPCELRVRVPGQRPAFVSVAEPGDPYTELHVATDARGIARLPYTPTASAEVTVTAPGCAPLRGTFEALGLPDRGLTPEAGKLLRGRVLDASGTPVTFCEVEVRDPSGIHLQTPRRTVSGEDGSFEIEGLPDATYTIWAQDVRQGRTFSAQARGVQPGRDVWDIVLRDEDPARPGAKKIPGPRRSPD